ncbi:MAG: phosphatase PAP2 family protein [Solobacterium sp.]|nr:phosphatase PAP2 family protein [Solobacterium sp.]
MDIEILLWFQGLRNALGELFSHSIALLSDGLCYVFVILAFILFWCKNKKLGKMMITSYAFSLWLNQFLKATFTINRPWIRDSRIIPPEFALKGATGYSFPSNHTQTNMSINGVLALNAKKNGARFTNILIIAFVAFSRIFIGVHTPQDVLVGLLAGGVAILICLAYNRYIQRRKNGELILLILFFLITVASILYVEFKSYPMTYVNNELLVDPITMKKDSMRSIAVFFTSFLAFYLEGKYVNFTTKVDNKTKYIRILFGLFGLVPIFLFSRFVLPILLPIEIARFWETFMLVFFAVYFYPLLFTKYEEKWMNFFISMKKN